MMMDTQKRAWIYSRIDAPEDTHGILKEQEKELYDYAKQMGFSIAGTSSDLGSGMDMDRPGLSRMSAAAEQGEFDVLLVRSISRLSRDTLQTVAILQKLERHGVEVCSPLEGRLNPAILPERLPLKDSGMGGHRHA